MCREILNSCVRNTEEAERLSKASEGSGVQSGRGQRKGVWGMIEESELAKSIRKGEEKRVRSNVVINTFRIAYPFISDSSKVIY
jgi:protein phosphatase 1 regulatory subunit 37